MALIKSLTAAFIFLLLPYTVHAQSVIKSGSYEWTNTKAEEHQYKCLAADPACAAGEGFTYCLDDGGTPVIRQCIAETISDVGSGAATVTWQNAVDDGRVVNDADSLAEAIRFGGATTAKQWCAYHTDATGHVLEACTAANQRTRIPVNKTGGWFDVEENSGTGEIEIIDPDGASSNAIWTYTNSGYRPLKSVVWNAGAISTDGTECSAAAEITINSGPKQWAVLCPMGTGAADGALYGSVVMPDSYDGGTVTFELTSVIDNDGGAGTFHGSAACGAAGNGDNFSATLGTEVDLDIVEAGGDAVWDILSVAGASAVTCAGTPAAGDWLLWRWIACGTTGQDANCNNSDASTQTDMSILSMKMEYSVDSRSD